MYDVVYLDQTGRQSLVGTHLGKESACELALSESRRRGVGRMFLAGSEEKPPGAQVLIVESAAQEAA